MGCPRWTITSPAVELDHVVDVGALGVGPQVDLEAGGVVHVEAFAGPPPGLGHGVRPRGQHLGFEGLGRPGGGHLGRGHALEVVLQGDPVDRLQAVPAGGEDELPAVGVVVLPGAPGDLAGPLVVHHEARPRLQGAQHQPGPGPQGALGGFGPVRGDDGEAGPAAVAGELQGGPRRGLRRRGPARLQGPLPAAPGDAQGLVRREAPRGVQQDADGRLRGHRLLDGGALVVGSHDLPRRLPGEGPSAGPPLAQPHPVAPAFALEGQGGGALGELVDERGLGPEGLGPAGRGAPRRGATAAQRRAPRARWPTARGQGEPLHSARPVSPPGGPAGPHDGLPATPDGANRV